MPCLFSWARQGELVAKVGAHLPGLTNPDFYYIFNTLDFLRGGVYRRNQVPEKPGLAVGRTLYDQGFSFPDWLFAKEELT